MARVRASASPTCRSRTQLTVAVAVALSLLFAVLAPSVRADTATIAEEPTEGPSSVVDPALEAKIERAPGEPVAVIAQFADDADAVAAAADLATDGEPMDAALPLVSTTVDPAAIERLRDAPGIVSVVEDREHTVDLETSAATIHAPAAWSAGYDGSGTRIAVLDTGVLRTHPFLADRITAEACFSGDASDNWSSGYCPGGDSHEATGTGAARPCDDRLNSRPICWHGTHVAGILVGHDGPAVAPSGVAPGAGLIAVQVFSRSNAGTVVARDSDLVEAMAWVGGQQSPSEPIVSLNLSLSGSRSTGACDDRGGDRMIKAQVDELRSVGITVVAAAGNDGDKAKIGSPACISTVVAVGALADSGSVASFSNSSAMLDVLAPGESITSSRFTYSGSAMIPGYGGVSGTSMATPMVSASISVIAQARGALPPSAFDQALARSGASVTDDANGRQAPLIQVDEARTVALDPIGVLELASTSAGQVRLRGWALDPDSAPAAEVEVRIGGVPARKAFADVERPDVFDAFGPWNPLGSGHGFDLVLAGLRTGPHAVCISALDTTASVRHPIACRTLQVTGGLPAIAPTFPDVPRGGTFSEAVEWLATKQATTGYPDGGFHPMSTVRRQGLIAMLYRLAGSPPVLLPTTPTFSDVGLGASFRKEIEWAAANDIIDGFADGTFKPGVALTRQGFAAILHRAIGAPAVMIPGHATFTDVPGTHTFRAPIEWLAMSGIADGNADGTFGTSAPLRRQALAAFLARHALALP